MMAISKKCEKIIHRRGKMNREYIKMLTEIKKIQITQNTFTLVENYSSDNIWCSRGCGPMGIMPLLGV